MFQKVWFAGQPIDLEDKMVPVSNQALEYLHGLQQAMPA